MIRNKLMKLGICTFSVIILAACASQETKQVPAEPDLAMQASDSPLGPPGVFSIERSADNKEVEVKSEQQQGFEGTLRKMTKNRMTLYWRETKDYTYSIGDAFEARYKPDEGLILKDASEDSGNLICKYNLDGNLDRSKLSKEKLKEQQKACADLMFTFDNQILE
jgi:hypothetical protein